VSTLSPGRRVSLFCAVLVVVSGVSCLNRNVLDSERERISLAHGSMAGEVTANSVILQTRLTSGTTLIDGDMPGAEGIARFEVSTSPDFDPLTATEWILSVPERDFIVKTKIEGLFPGTQYYYRVRYGEEEEGSETGPTCSFKTLDPKGRASEVSFVVVTGMNYWKFHYVPGQAYEGSDKYLGYPALESIVEMAPDFFVGTGDNVYYDNRPQPATTREELRRCWHEQFVQPRFVNLFARVPTYWEKDDHDHRYNDCDTTGKREPSNELGTMTFLEQVPVADPAVAHPVTYRKHGINRLLEIWFVEGRDYRSPNLMEDGPEKSMWGETQKSWLLRTLLDSDAVFKILISPTPMIGPDDSYKRDNHTNPKGFKHEGEQFFRWLAENGFQRKNFYIICGDRHWQYHSVRRDGFEEFSCGALVDANSRMGRRPGDPESTDPEGQIRQVYAQDEPSGGFLNVTVRPGENGQAPTAEFAFYDENGVLGYRCTKTAG